MKLRFKVIISLALALGASPLAQGADAVSSRLNNSSPVNDYKWRADICYKFDAGTDNYVRVPFENIKKGGDCWSDVLDMNRVAKAYNVDLAKTEGIEVSTPAAAPAPKVAIQARAVKHVTLPETREAYIAKYWSPQATPGHNFWGEIAKFRTDGEAAGYANSVASRYPQIAVGWYPDYGSGFSTVQVAGNVTEASANEALDLARQLGIDKLGLRAHHLKL